jgi:hypothetical protein
MGRCHQPPFVKGAFIVVTICLCKLRGEGEEAQKFNQFANHKSPLKITRLYSWPFPNSNIFPFAWNDHWECIETKKAL